MAAAEVSASVIQPDQRRNAISSGVSFFEVITPRAVSATVITIGAWRVMWWIYSMDMRVEIRG